RVLINRDCSAIAGRRKRRVLVVCRKLRRFSAAVATSREGHLSGLHPVAPHAPECLGAFVIWTDFKCPIRSTLQIRCRRTALRARRSRIRANADYRKALDPPPLKVGL